MVKIELESAENGVIKTIVDDNINGAGSNFTKKSVFVITRENKLGPISEFVHELLMDLGIYTGNKFSNDNIRIIEDWGKSYEPTEEDLTNKINEMTTKLKYLKEQLKLIKSDKKH